MPHNSIAICLGFEIAYLRPFRRWTVLIAKWIEDEFAHVELGDQRLHKRLKTCVAQFSRMGQSVPDRCRSKADIKATNRFADNEKVSMCSILQEHNWASRQRCLGNDRVYLIQDTTEIDLTKPKQQVAGAGPLGTKNRRGFFYHPLYAVDQDGLSLGAVDQMIWERDDQSLEKTAKQRKVERKQACYEEKESCRWKEMLQSGEQLARSQPDTQFIMVADSEADMGELFCEAAECCTNFDFVIRGARAHAIIEATDLSTGESIAAPTVQEALSQAELRFRREVYIGRRDSPVLPDDKKRRRKQGRESRCASLSIRSISVTIKGTRCSNGITLDDAKMNVVEALEENPKENDVPVHWILYTTRPVATQAQIVDVLNTYCQRWLIEIYFKTLKDGMKVEDMKYETLSRYQVVFAMLSVVAWRVEYLKSAARHDSESSCEKYFTNDQWMAIVMFVTQKRPDPKQPPTVGQFLITIAQLGGYVNKKSQGPPGSKTIWRGMSQFETITEAYRIFSQMNCGA